MATMEDSTNYNDVIQVLAGNKDLKLSLSSQSLALLVFGVFIAMLAALLVAKNV